MDQLSSKLRWGVIGTAYWAREVHIPGLRKAGMDVVGLWGRTVETVESIAAQYDLKPFRQLSDLLEACDVVTVAVPPHAQEAIALKACAAGCHMILEKPLALDYEAAKRIQEAATRNHLAALVFLMRRFVPEIAALIDANHAHAWHSAKVRVHSDVMARQSPYSDSEWRKASGAASWDISPHILSLLIPMLGPVTGIEQVSNIDQIMNYRTLHEGGARADVSVSLHSSLEAVSNTYRFESPSRILLFPEGPVDRIEAFALAARNLQQGILKKNYHFACDLAFGAEIVRWIEFIDRCYQTSYQSLKNHNS